MKKEEKLSCAFCGDPVGEKVVRQSGKVYCCEGCAYEAGRAKDCAGRTDTTRSQPVVESDKGK
jgi:ribosomal protein L37AE/L43A